KEAELAHATRMRQQNVLASAVSGQPNTFPWIATRGHFISLTAGHRSCAAFAIRRTQNANSKTVGSAPIAARNTKRDENAVVNIFVEGLRILAERPSAKIREPSTKILTTAFSSRSVLRH